MRIITRPDFDGVVCAVLLIEALGVTEPILWVEPNDMQHKRIDVQSGDIIANLAYHENCFLWFDHHSSNKINTFFRGGFALAPSAARVAYDFFQNYIHNSDWPLPVKPFSRDFSELVAAADKIDTAQLTEDEILHPEKYPYVGIAATINDEQHDQEKYWNHLVNLFSTYSVDDIFKDSEVMMRLSRVKQANIEYCSYLMQHTKVQGHISITDFRELCEAPVGNRFLVFSLFPQTIVNLRVRCHHQDKNKIIISIGQSIVNRNCGINIGQLCAQFNGGGHKGAGSCHFPADQYEKNLTHILDVLSAN
jgi:oligoribonuclease NrnB/cAMP/cGMP phosphodiesterase (DHH superfamily)